MKWIIVQCGCGHYNLALKEKSLKIDESINVLLEQIPVHAVDIGARARNNIGKTIKKWACIFA
jgi:hypothetical protein